jgi:ferredoxin
MSASNINPFWHDIPRETIAWFPTVAADRCHGCGLCATSCGRKVYQFDYTNNRAVVTQPFNCMVGCSTCATICPQEAIEFPSRSYIQHLIREKHVDQHSKSLLRDHPEDYRVQE